MEQRKTEGNPCREPPQQPEPTGLDTVTLITPDDIIAEEGPVPPACGGAVSPERVAEDVTTINPSIESMEGRG